MLNGSKKRNLFRWNFAIPLSDFSLTSCILIPKENRKECEWHLHKLNFQMVYILKGWVTFEYEGQGTFTFHEGDSVLQPPKISHREIEHSEDLELLEITSPASFDTETV